MSPRSHPSEVPRSMRNGAQYEELQQAASALSATRSKRSNRDPDTTPTPSRPASPGLTTHEQQMVNDLLNRPARARTSFAQSTVAPSALEPDIINSHYHDMELCQLLHALDQPMGEPVKKAVRKAVRARVKKLGMKYDAEVRRVSSDRCSLFTEPSHLSLSSNTASRTTIMTHRYTSTYRLLPQLPDPDGLHRLLSHRSPPNGRKTSLMA